MSALFGSSHRPGHHGRPDVHAEQRERARRRHRRRPSWAPPLAIGDMTGSTTGDLAAGMPGKDVGGLNDAGQVLVLPGNGTVGLTASGSHVRRPEHGRRGRHGGGGRPLRGRAASPATSPAPPRPTWPSARRARAWERRRGRVRSRSCSARPATLTGTGGTIWNQDTAGVFDTRGGQRPPRSDARRRPVGQRRPARPGARHRRTRTSARSRTPVRWA